MTSKKEHRQGKKTVCIIGMAVTSRDKAPFDDPDVEIWALNEGYRHGAKNYTRLFQLHPRWDFLRSENFNDPYHPQWLLGEPRPCWVCMPEKDSKPNPECKQCGGKGELVRSMDFRIMMQEEHPDIPGSEEFPLQEILDDMVPAEFHEEIREQMIRDVKYATSTMPYMIGLAIYEGFDRIELYGFEMASETEYVDQKPCAEFWMGLAYGRGLEVYLPKGCRLLGQSTKLYGYEAVKGLNRMHLEIQRNNAKKKRASHTEELNKIRGRRQEIQAKVNSEQNPRRKQTLIKQDQELLAQEIKQFGFQQLWHGFTLSHKQLMQDFDMQKGRETKMELM
jgi:hypothetical protein